MEKISKKPAITNLTATLNGIQHHLRRVICSMSDSSGVNPVRTDPKEEIAVRVNINGTCVYDDILGIGIRKEAEHKTAIPELTAQPRELLKRTLPELIGITGLTSVLMAHPTVVFAADAGAKLYAKEESIIHTLQSIATPAAIAIAIWGLIEWAVLNNPHGKKKIWESLWLLIGIKFIPDLWMTIAA